MDPKDDEYKLGNAHVQNITELILNNTKQYKPKCMKSNMIDQHNIDIDNIFTTIQSQQNTSNTTAW